MGIKWRNIGKMKNEKRQGDGSRLEPVGFDADDTLWHNGTVLSPDPNSYCRGPNLLARIIANPDHLAKKKPGRASRGRERRKPLAPYGFGNQGFVLFDDTRDRESEVSDPANRCPPAVMPGCCRAGQGTCWPIPDSNCCPIPRGRRGACPGWPELVLIHQGRPAGPGTKLAQSGLGARWGSTRSRSSATKTRDTISRIFARATDTGASE